MEKTYYFEVKIVSDCVISAENEKKARETLLGFWKDDNNIELMDSEIKLTSVSSK